MTKIETTDDSSRYMEVTQASSIELFSGAGGLALGLSSANLHPVLTVERDAQACHTLLANAARPFVAEQADSPSGGRGWPLVQADVRDVDFSPLRGAVSAQGL
jgi:DNA (cytosine-5)-methyltransferase 1